MVVFIVIRNGRSALIGFYHYVYIYVFIYVYICVYILYVRFTRIGATLLFARNERMPGK